MINTLIHIASRITPRFQYHPEGSYIILYHYSLYKHSSNTTNKYTGFQNLSKTNPKCHSYVNDFSLFVDEHVNGVQNNKQKNIVTVMDIEKELWLPNKYINKRKSVQIGNISSLALIDIFVNSIIVNISIV